MTNLGYQILFWLEVGLGVIALTYAALALYTVLPRRPKARIVLGKPLPEKLAPGERVDRSAGLLVSVTALGVVIAAVAGIFPNPYLQRLGVTHPRVTITQIAQVSGDPCERDIFLTASIPSGDVIAVGLMDQAGSEEDFQSKVMQHSAHEWTSSILLGGVSQAGHTFFVTPIVLPAASERDFLDVIRTNSTSAADSTYWPTTGPPSSTMYVGAPRKVIRSSVTAGCPPLTGG